MSPGTRLSDAEVAKIRTLHEEGHRPAEIARRVKRSRNAIVNVLTQKISKKNLKRIGRPRKISSKVMRALIRKARTGVYTAAELRRMFQIDVSVRRVQQILQADDSLSWKRINSAPPLTKRH